MIKFLTSTVAGDGGKSALIMLLPKSIAIFLTYVARSKKSRITKIVEIAGLKKYSKTVCFKQLTKFIFTLISLIFFSGVETIQSC